MGLVADRVGPLLGVVTSSSARGTNCRPMPSSGSPISSATSGVIDTA